MRSLDVNALGVDETGCGYLLPPGAEPPAVKALLDKLRPLCHGLSVCGAGGGGFVACITKTPGDKARYVIDCSTPYNSFFRLLMLLARLSDGWTSVLDGCCPCQA